jgi:type II secretory ATPase GspE/PulE/Tfp pilus assembly ATPase PilB-like protein
MVMDHAVREMTVTGASLEEVRASTLASGNLQPLQADGAQKVLEGITSTTEVLRVTRAAGNAMDERELV